MPAQRVYCTFCGQTFVCSDLQTCSLCNKSGGLLDPMSPAALHDLADKKRGQSSPDSRLDATRTGWLALSFAGVVAITIGILMLLSSFRENSRSNGQYEILIAFGSIAAGVLVGAFTFWAWRTGWFRDKK